MTQYVDKNSYSYKMAMESFAAMAIDQPVKDRLNYRAAAMEAATGPDAGMVVERLYKSIVGRASTNFGKIPDSQGDLTRFVKYKSITETMELLDRQTSGQKIMELALAHELHDNLIRLRESFAFGFKNDSQFLKTTYNTMVYSLCELLNLCDVIYIDMLKANAEGKPFKYTPYSDLLLVQNIKKFNDMVRSGEWDQMMNTIRKDSSHLFDIIFGGTNSEGKNDKNGLLHFIAGSGIGVGAITAGAVKMSPGASLGTALKDFPGKAFGAMTRTAVGKVATVVIIIIASLMIIRGLIMLFWSATYKIHEMIDDAEKLLKAHMDVEARDGNVNQKAMDKQQKMYDALKGIRDKMESSILKDDEKAKKNLKDSNRAEMTIANRKEVNEDLPDNLVIG